MEDIRKEFEKNIHIDTDKVNALKDAGTQLRFKKFMLEQQLKDSELSDENRKEITGEISSIAEEISSNDSELSIARQGYTDADLYAFWQKFVEEHNKQIAPYLKKYEDARLKFYDAFTELLTMQNRALKDRLALSDYVTGCIYDSPIYRIAQLDSVAKPILLDDTSACNAFTAELEKDFNLDLNEIQTCIVNEYYTEKLDKKKSIF